MTAAKTLALGAILVGAAALSAKADSMTNGSTQWTLWSSGSDLFGNMGPAPVASLPAPAPQASWNVAPAPVNTISNASPMLAPALPTFSAPAPMPTPTPTATGSAAPSYDAYINLGNGPYPNSGFLTTGNAQPWYNSQQITSLFGGQPNAQQQAAFDSAVLQRVQQTFALSGVPVTLTNDPNASAAHTLSVVSNTTSSWGPLLGLTQVGTNGFDFVDQAAKSSSSVDQLEWIVAHNVAHELMLAFGVGENYDKSGNFIDAPIANWSMLVDPNAQFSQAASQALLNSTMMGTSGSLNALGAQSVATQAVPEPATMAVWTISLGGFWLARARRNKIAA